MAWVAHLRGADDANRDDHACALCGGPLPSVYWLWRYDAVPTRTPDSRFPDVVQDRIGGKAHRDCWEARRRREG